MDNFLCLNCTSDTVRVMIFEFKRAIETTQRCERDSQMTFITLAFTITVPMI